MVNILKTIITSLRRSKAHSLCFRRKWRKLPLCSLVAPVSEQAALHLYHLQRQVIVRFVSLFFLSKQMQAFVLCLGIPLGCLGVDFLTKIKLSNPPAPLFKKGGTIVRGKKFAERKFFAPWEFYALKFVFHKFKGMFINK